MSRGSPEWSKRDVEILDVPLEVYVAGLSERLQALPAAPARA
jgi:hypothetical protein